MQQKNVLKPTHDALFERFRQAFPEAKIQVEDESICTSVTSALQVVPVIFESR